METLIEMDFDAGYVHGLSGRPITLSLYGHVLDSGIVIRSNSIYRMGYEIGKALAEASE